jgi:hypothetical protein
VQTTPFFSRYFMAQHCQLAVIVMSVVWLLGGCKGSGSDSAPAAPNSAKPLAHLRPADLGPTATMLKSGTLPISYICGAGGKIRVVDTTAGKTLVNANVDPNTIISIHATEGIVLGRQTALRGPLTAEHRYEIWWDAGK